VRALVCHGHFWLCWPFYRAPSFLAVLQVCFWSKKVMSYLGSKAQRGEKFSVTAERLAIMVALGEVDQV
jgi:hypothetical protein